MTDFATPADVIAAMAAAGNGGDGCRQLGYKASLTSVAGFYYSLWLATGSNGPGVAPTSWAVPTKATVGSWNPMMNNATSGRTNRLLYSSFTFPSSVLLNLSDRVGHMAGLSGTSTGAQTVNGTLTSQAAAGRCAADGSDVMWFLEWYTATGSSAVTATVNVTYGDDTTGNVTVSLPASVPASRKYPIVSNVNGKSIKGVNTVQNSATTGTAGNFGVTAEKWLATHNSSWANNQGSAQDWAMLGMPKVADDACICPFAFANTTSTGAMQYSLTIGSA
jgi:hypothetical protein